MGGAGSCKGVAPFPVSKLRERAPLGGAAGVVVGWVLALVGILWPVGRAPTSPRDASMALEAAGSALVAASTAVPGGVGVAGRVQPGGAAGAGGLGRGRMPRGAAHRVEWLVPRPAAAGCAAARAAARGAGCEAASCLVTTTACCRRGRAGWLGGRDGWLGGRAGVPVAAFRLVAMPSGVPPVRAWWRGQCRRLGTCWCRTSAGRPGGWRGALSADQCGPGAPA